MYDSVGISGEDLWILKATLQMPRPEAHPDPPETSLRLMDSCLDANKAPRASGKELGERAQFTEEPFEDNRSTWGEVFSQAFIHSFLSHGSWDVHSCDTGKCEKAVSCRERAEVVPTG